MGTVPIRVVKRLCVVKNSVFMQYKWALSNHSSCVFVFSGSDEVCRIWCNEQHCADSDLVLCSVREQQHPVPCCHLLVGV